MEEVTRANEALQKNLSDSQPVDAIFALQSKNEELEVVLEVQQKELDELRKTHGKEVEHLRRRSFSKESSNLNVKRKSAKLKARPEN